MAAKRWIKRRRAGKGFHYSENGQPITDQAILAYVHSLHIPPAWQAVQIAGNTRAKLLATGIDSAGRKQYIYHPSYRVKQEQAKFDRMLRFAQALPRMRSVTAQHIRRPRLDHKKVLACIVALMDEAYLRVGNATYAKTNNSYGITTLRSKHTNVERNTITFDFIGKSGQHHTKKITSQSLARIVQQLDELPGYEVFRYYTTTGQLVNIQSSDVNTYIKKIMGEEFSAKDFRTWGGTVMTVTELTRHIRPVSATERRKVVTHCIQHVARLLGNTPAITRSAYVDPRIIAAYTDTDKLLGTYKRLKSATSNSQYSLEEQCAMHVLTTL
jgi:DNA topoisomerase-1